MLNRKTTGFGNSSEEITGLFHDPDEGVDASKIPKPFSKSWENIIMTGLLHDPERGVMLVKSLKLFSKVGKT